MSCSLFVAEVRGSRKCSVCRCDISAHQPAAIYVAPERIFSNLPPIPTSFSCSNNTSFSRMSNPRSSSNSNNNNSNNHNSSLAMSEHSAFSPYARSPDPRSLSQASTNPPVPPHVVLRPEPRFALAPILPRQEGSDSNISKKIRGKRRERPRSVGLLDLGATTLNFSDSQKVPNSSSTSQRGSPLIPETRSNDFKLILQRFQSADKDSSPELLPTPSVQQSQHYASPHHLMSPPIATWSATPTSKMGGSQESWSTPPHRCSLNSNYRESPVGSRNTSARSRLSVSSAQSPHCFLPTRDSSPRSIPSPSMVPMRPDSSPDITINELHHSPLSHTGSTPEPTERAKPVPKMQSRRASYTTGYPTTQHDIFSQPRWVKETDVDDPLSLPTMSPIGSLESSEGHHGGNHQPLRSAPLSKRASIEKLDGQVPMRENSSRGYNNRSVRKSVIAGHNPSPNGIYVRRSRSKDDRPSLNYMNYNGIDQRVSPPRTASIPIFMSQESISHSAMQSPMMSPAQSSQPIATRQSNHNLTQDELYKHFQQISLSHVHTLNVVADKLSEDARRGEEPVSRNRLAQLDFSSFIVTSPHPILTKGKSLFYNAVLPRQGLPDYAVTLMIAPCSQYAPLMRKTESNHFGLPGFLEIEDHDGAIRQFLYDTGTQNLDGRNTKIIAMPRLNLCSFHSLAAHQLDQRLDRTRHEELVSFILLQVLSALKMLQGEGVESLSTNFKEFLLAYRFHNINSNYHEFPRLLFLPETLGAEIESGGDELVGLCRYALRALCTLLHHKMDGRAPAIKLRSRFSRALSACAILLQEDKSNSLTKAKNVLELSLWSGGEHFKSEHEGRVWIDTARAECVDNLVRQMIVEPGRSLGARERFRIEFLLSATPRSVMESQKATMAANVK